MSRYVAFLRAINTTGRRAKNVQLSDAFRNVGASYAQGFLASGNVVFDIDRPVDDDLVEEIELALHAMCGFDIPTIIRTAAEVRLVSQCRPFAIELINRSTGQLYAGFLKSTPNAENIENVVARSTRSDLLAIHERELYWLPMASEFESDISIPRLERELGTMTVRVMNTVNRIVDSFLAIE